MTETGVAMDDVFDPTTDLSCADAEVVATQKRIRGSQVPCFVEACWVEIEKKFEVKIMIGLLLKGVRKICCRLLEIEWCNFLLACRHEQFTRFVVAESALPRH